MAEWTSSELNTSEWHIAQYDSLYVINADATYCIDVFKDAFNTVTARPYQAEISEPETSPAFRERFAYCVNSETKLHIGGFKVFGEKGSEPSYSNNYGMSHLSPFFAADDTITIGGYGTPKSVVKNMEIYMVRHDGNGETVPYDNNVEVIRSKGTKIEAEFVSYDEHVAGLPYGVDYYNKNMFEA